MNKVSFLQADHKPCRGILAQIMSVDHSPIPTAVYGMDPFVADMALHDPYRIEKLCVFAFDRSIGVRFTVQRDHRVLSISAATILHR